MVSDVQQGGRPLGAPLPHGVTEQLPVDGLDVKEVSVKDANEGAVAASQLLDQQHAEAMKEIASQQPKGMRTRDISELPPDEQRDIKNLLGQAKSQLESIQAPKNMTIVPLREDEEEQQPKTEKPVNPDNPLLGRCPNCGWDTSNTNTLDVSEEDKRMWVRSLISGQRFVRKYSLYGGQLDIILRSPLARERSTCISETANQVKGGNVTVESLGAVHNRILLSFCLDSIRSQDGALSMEFKSPVSGADAMTWFDNTPDSLVQTAIQCLIHFEMLCARMHLMSRDPDFFSQPGGAS